MEKENEILASLPDSLEIELQSETDQEDENVFVITRLGKEGNWVYG